MAEKDHSYYMRLAFECAREEMLNGNGGPFGAVILRDGKIIGKSGNRVFAEKDPTAHGEIMAIRNACQNINDPYLEDCVMYSTCEPCAMCFSAIFYAGIKKVYYAAYHKDADRIAGFGVDKLYAELKKPLDERNIDHIQLLHKEGVDLLQEWANKDLAAKEKSQDRQH